MLTTLSRPGDPVERSADGLAGDAGPAPVAELRSVGQWSIGTIDLTGERPAALSGPGAELITGLGEGRPIPPADRRALEDRVGAGLEGVRLHDGAAGEDLARRAGANALTVGTDIAALPGALSTATAAGRSRLLHEVAHVAQQHLDPRLAGTGMRDPAPNTPAPATTLAGLPAKERKRLQVVTNLTAIVPDLAGKFSPANAPKGTATLDGTISMVWDASVPTKLRGGLLNVTRALVKDFTPPVLKGDTTVTLHLDLSTHGGVDGLYRFTRVMSPPAKAAKGAKAAPATGSKVVVESLGKALSPSGTKKPAPAKKGAPAPADPIAKKMAAHGITETLSGAEEEALRAAISQVPSSDLARVKGLRFVKGQVSAKDAQAGGEYDPVDHKITLSDKAFEKTDVAHGTPVSGGVRASSNATTVILHEIGHAIDLAPLRAARLAREAAEAKVVADYPDPQNKGGYSWSSPAEKADIDKRLKAASAAQKKARSLSGTRTDMVKGVWTDIIGTKVGKNKFRAAAKKDDPKAVSTYGETDWQEAWAEAYSLFVSAPEVLKATRPATYAHMKAVLR